MSYNKRRIEYLEEQHQELNKRIDGMESTGVFDDVLLNVLKKQRLYLKTQIVTLKQEDSSTYYTTEQND